MRFDMDPIKRAKIEAKGFKVGTIAELLGLTPEEEIAVAKAMQHHRDTKDSDRDWAESMAKDIVGTK
jgi:hypothetical protein